MIEKVNVSGGVFIANRGTVLTQDILKYLLSYNPDSGFFTRLVKTSNKVKVGDIAGNPTKSGHIEIRVLNKAQYAHRLAWLYMTGEWPFGVIDHIDGNGYNNRWVNIRDCSHKENIRNSKLASTNTTGVKGVSWSTLKSKYVAQLVTDGVRRQLGYFASLEEAEQAVRAARELHHGDFANHGETQ